MVVDLSHMQIAASIDWKINTVAFPAVRNQGSCGSCWAVSSATVIEGLYAIKGGLTDVTTGPISEQDLLDCTPVSNGCDGGWPDWAFYYTKTNSVANGYLYPYTGVKAACRRSETTLFDSLASINTQYKK